MAFGAGFLKQMNDTMKYNRDLLGKKKSLREIYREEVRKSGVHIDKLALENVRERVALALKRDRTGEILSKALAIIIALSLLFILLWFFVFSDFNNKQPVKHVNKTHLYKTIIYDQLNGNKLKTDYFIRGPKAAETNLKDGRKHQNSESYYESGEQFRSALYYYDTLITEFYFYKSGDTIKNFPALSENKIYRVKLLSTLKDKSIEFDFYDGKIVQGTYQENVLVK